jgi:hypothetical protein
VFTILAKRLRRAVRDAGVVLVPDGRKFEIRFIPGAPHERNYEVLRELGKSAA